jgi:hypothetical protein
MGGRYRRVILRYSQKKTLKIVANALRCGPNPPIPLCMKQLSGRQSAIVPANFGPPGNSHPSCPTPQPPREVPLELPFGYDPARGNLLLELRVFGVSPWPDEAPPWWPPNTGAPHNRLDAVSVPGDAVSRAAAFSLETDTAEVLDTTGLWTMFQFNAPPSLTVRYETNTVVLSWPMWPQAFRLQSAERLDASAFWQDYGGASTMDGIYKHVSVPRAELVRSRFYRLFLDTPQPLVGVLATEPVCLDQEITP